MAARIAIGFVLAVCSAAASAQAGSLGSARPESVGLSSPRLEWLDATMQAYVDDQKLAGVVTLIARRGRVAYFKAVGMQNRESGVPMKRDSLFRIYSMSKPIVSVAVLMLLERGDILLDDPITKYIPELESLRVIEDPAGPLDRTRSLERPITIRDLLVHTAGFGYDWITPPGPLADAYRTLDRDAWSLDLPSFIRRLAALPLVYQPGTRWHYGMSTDVLGQLVAVVSGVPLDRFLRERIFEPLDMVDTGFQVPPGKLDRFTTSYGPSEGPAEGGRLRVLDVPSESHFARPPIWLSGGGGLISTASDYARFAQMLLQGGELDGQRILGRKTVEFMTRNQLSEQEMQADFLKTALRGNGFGLGVSVVTDETRRPYPGSKGEYGWSGAASTTFWVDPAEDLAVVQMTQLTPVADTFGKLHVLVYAALTD
jgi:CubicO group peptidase (beta-lactamase class C family)